MTSRGGDQGDKGDQGDEEDKEDKEDQGDQDEFIVGQLFLPCWTSKLLVVR